MMKIRNTMVSLVAVTALFTACGGGGGGTHEEVVDPVENITFISNADTIKVMPGQRKSVKLSVGKDLYDPNGFLYNFKILEKPDDITDARIDNDGILLFIAPNAVGQSFSIKVQATRGNDIGKTTLNFVTADSVTTMKTIVKTGANDGGSGVDRTFAEDGKGNVKGVKDLVWADKSINVPDDVTGKKYEEAKDYCERTLASIDGGNWRLPTIDELLDTVDYSEEVGKNGSYVYGNAFSRPLLTSWAEMKNGKKYYLHNEMAIILEDNTNKFMTRCVQGAKETSEHLVYIGEFEGDTFDLSTNLQWTPAETMNASAAKDYCANLDHNGKTDWRMPSINELRSIVENGSVSSFITKGTQLISATPYNDGNDSSSLNWGIYLNADVTTSVLQMYVKKPDTNEDVEYPITCVRKIN